MRRVSAIARRNVPVAILPVAISRQRARRHARRREPPGRRDVHLAAQRPVFEPDARLAEQAHNRLIGQALTFPAGASRTVLDSLGPSRSVVAPDRPDDLRAPRHLRARPMPQHAIRRVGRQPVGEQAAGGARAAHDVIEALLVHPSPRADASPRMRARRTGTLPRAVRVHDITTTCRIDSPRASRSSAGLISSSAMRSDSNSFTGSEPRRCIAMKRGMSREGTHEPT